MVESEDIFSLPLTSILWYGTLMCAYLRIKDITVYVYKLNKPSTCQRTKIIRDYSLNIEEFLFW